MYIDLKVNVPKLNATIFWTPIFEWYVVGLKGRVWDEYNSLIPLEPCDSLDGCALVIFATNCTQKHVVSYGSKNHTIYGI